MSDDYKNKWAEPPLEDVLEEALENVPADDDDDEAIDDLEVEKEATAAALATAELFQNLDLDEPETVPSTRRFPDAVPAQNDDLAVDDEPAGMKMRVGMGFSRGLFWLVGLAFGLMIAASIGIVWMIFNILAKLA